jgi:CubicO group peptidase (beta-lactamase class C family)
MGETIRITAAATLAILLCGAAVRAATDEHAEEVDALFSEWDTTETPGAVVAVIQNGKIIYQNAYGMADLERNVLLSPNSLFDIASISKQFTAMSILLLEDEGRLSLDDDIRTHLPSFPDYGHPITLRHMIHHTSGLRDYMDLMELAGMPWENHYHRPRSSTWLPDKERSITFPETTIFTATPATSCWRRSYTKSLERRWESLPDDTSSSRSA